VLRSLATYTSIPPDSTTLFQYGFNEQFTDWSNEFRVTSGQNQRLRWTAGATQIHVVQLVEITAAFTFAGNTIPDAPTYDSIQRTNTYGAFAGGYFDIIDGLTLSAEGRYQRDNEEQGAATANPRLFLSKLYQSFQPRVSLDWKVTPNVTPYMSYASGTRPGGFNAILVGQPASVVSQITAQTGLNSPAYDEEKLTTFEIGIKGSAFDHRLSGSIDAYYGNLTNGQISQTVNYTPPGGGIIGVNLVSNLGKVQIDGLEIEGAWQVLPRLALSGTFALNETNILAYPCTPCLATIGTEDVKGNSLPLAPQVAGSLALDYNQPLARDWTGFFHVDDAYRGKRWEDFENIAYIPAANYVNLRLGAKTGSLTIEAFVTNLTNDLTLTGAQRLNDTIDGSLQFRVGLPDKRNFGGRLLYRF
jgi:iron complex outermembrane receptor protein